MNPKTFIFAFLVFIFVFKNATVCFAQENDPITEAVKSPVATQKVDVNPTAGDHDIQQRIERILGATGWFHNIEVNVDEGIVFLEGRTTSSNHKDWAENVASKTQDVVAVVNKIDVRTKPHWDLSPAWIEIQNLITKFIQNLPLILLAIIMFALTWFSTIWAARGAGTILQKKLKSPLLRDVASRAVAIPVFLLGLYLVLRVSGLTRLAATVLGGTGLLGLIIGFAFRDIAENFLASVLISLQHPFARGDLIRVAEFEGYVQSVNSRATLLMTLDGNHIQIPNATIYKETIVNYTANPNARFNFQIGVGYDDSISKAQSVAMRVLQMHEAVLKDPESMVLVEALGSATISLRIYYWIDITKFSQYKVRSAIIRLTKKAFEEANISMPDEAREVIFPKGVPVQMISEPESASIKTPADRVKPEETENTICEGGLGSEASTIKEQAEKSRTPEQGADLLDH